MVKGLWACIFVACLSDEPYLVYAKIDAKNMGDPADL
jgi:hypothetical protein